MKNTIIFLHIPKTAGTTLQQAMERQFAASEMFSINAPASASVERFRHLPQSQKNAFRCIKGHTRYGIHQQIDNDCDYFTFLRNPVKRVVSDFYYALNHSSKLFRERSKECKNDIVRYVEADYCWDNLMSRWLLNELYNGEMIQNTDEVFQALINHVSKKIKFVGITERFDESLVLLSEVFNFSPLYYASRNTAGKKRPPISDEGLDAVKRNNAMDIRLYDWACDNFQNLWESNLSEHESALTRLKQMNCERKWQIEMGTCFNYYYNRVFWKLKGWR